MTTTEQIKELRESKTVRPPKNKAAPKAARKLSVMIDFFEWADGKAVDITKKQAETKE